MSHNRQFLAEVHWGSKASDPTALSRLNVRYGFTGLSNELFQGHNVKQVHGTSIVRANSERGKTSDGVCCEADGLYTSERNLAIGVKTADCLPILLADSENTVMALHAGWRGLTQGIVNKGVELLLSSSAHKIHVLCGPAIDACHYEVGPDVIDALSSSALGLTSEQVGFCLRKGSQDRWYFDLATAAALCCRNHEIPARNISVVRSCTFETENGWHSFRRDGNRVGRNWSWIMLSPQDHALSHT